MSSIKDAFEKIKERKNTVIKTVMDVIETIPKPVAERPTLILRQTFIKRIINNRIGKVRRKINVSP